MTLGCFINFTRRLGFAPPSPEDKAREVDAELLGVAKMFLAVGVDETSLLVSPPVR